MYSERKRDHYDLYMIPLNNTTTQFICRKITLQLNLSVAKQIRAKKIYCSCLLSTFKINYLYYAWFASMLSARYYFIRQVIYLSVKRE
jgi:hypothetical protein